MKRNRECNRPADLPYLFFSFFLFLQVAYHPPCSFNFLIFPDCTVFTGVGLFGTTRKIHTVQHASYNSTIFRGVQDPDFRTRVRQDSAHFQQTGSDPDYSFIQVSRSGSVSGYSNFTVLGFDANTIIKRIFAKLKDVM